MVKHKLAAESEFIKKPAEIDVLEATSFDLLLGTNAFKALIIIFITYTGGLHSSS